MPVIPDHEGVFAASISIYAMLFGTYGERIGEQRGAEKAILETIKNLKETMKWTTKQAMDAMKLPKEDQKKYEKLV